MFTGMKYWQKAKMKGLNKNMSEYNWSWSVCPKCFWV